MSGYYVKGSARGTTPGRIVSVVCTTRVPDGRAVAGCPVPTVLDRVFVAWAARSRHVYSFPRSVSFGDPDAFWAFLESIDTGRGRVVVVSDCASDSLTWLQMWDRWTNHGARWKPKRSPGKAVAPPQQQAGRYVVRTRALHRRPDILEYTAGKTSFGWYGVRQYLDLDDEELADAVGFEWPGWDRAGSAGTHPTRTAAHRALLYLHAAERYACWWASLMAGPWPRTTASAAGMFLRSRLPKRTVCTHDCPLTHDLERQAAHSGRASVWYYGHVCPHTRGPKSRRLPFPRSQYPPTRGPIHHWDYSSMFPALLSQREFPTKRSHASTDCSVESLRAHLKHFLAIAHVRLRSDSAEYPHRERNRVVYPVGTFTATLTTPELLSALAADELRQVYHVAYYFKGRPYQVAADELLALRKRYKDEGNHGWEAMVKALSNSMTGRLNQRPTRWEPRPNVWPPILWGEWFSEPAAGKAVKRFRASAGVVEEMVRDLPAPGTLAAGYCHLTAYSRVLMRWLREQLPDRSVFQQDTDGLWVTSQAADTLDTLSRDPLSSLPRLRHTHSTRFARFYSPKHYYHDGGWVCAGLSDPRFAAGSAAYVSTRRLNAARGSSHEPPREVYVVEGGGEVDPPAPDGFVTPSGWIDPPTRPRHGLRGGGGGGGGLFGDPP